MTTQDKKHFYDAQPAYLVSKRAMFNDICVGEATGAFFFNVIAAGSIARPVLTTSTVLSLFVASLFILCAVSRHRSVSPPSPGKTKFLSLVVKKKTVFFSPYFFPGCTRQAD